MDKMDRLLGSGSPFIQANIVLHEQQVLIRQIQGPERRGEVQLL